MKSQYTGLEILYSMKLVQPVFVVVLADLRINISKCLIQGVSVQAHSHSFCYAHTVDHNHGL